MRTTKDRIFHAISFEIIGLLLVVPLGTWTFGKPLPDIGVVAIFGATIATCWNYIYNLTFDTVLLRVTGQVHKTVITRVFHSVLFEIGLLSILLPFIAWYLGASLVHAFQMDISFAFFYIVYAFIFNWGYDTIFPVPSYPDAGSA